MNKKIVVTNAILKEKDQVVELIAESGYSLINLKPMEQMLVDSDHLSFIYITDLQDEYQYVSIPHSLWANLKIALELQWDIYLADGDQKLLLPGFLEELTYLIENIKGNSNYGDAMVEKVESIF